MSNVLVHTQSTFNLARTSPIRIHCRLASCKDASLLTGSSPNRKVSFASERFSRDFTDETESRQFVFSFCSFNCARPKASPILLSWNEPLKARYRPDSARDLTGKSLPRSSSGIERERQPHVSFRLFRIRSSCVSRIPTLLKSSPIDEESPARLAAVAKNVY